MQIETEAYILGMENIHSSKTGKDFVKFSFVIEGAFCSFFTRAQEGNEIAKSKPCAEFSKTHQPTKCAAVLSLKFTDKGTYTDLKAVR